MKKLVLTIVMLVGSAVAQIPFPAGQPYQVLKSSDCTATTCTPNTIDLTGTLTGGFPVSDGVGYYKISWTINGTVASCSVSLDSQTNAGAAWTTGGIVAAATIGSCASQGSYTLSSNPVYVNYARATPTITCTGTCDVNFTVIAGLYPSSVAGGAPSGSSLSSGTTNRIAIYTASTTIGSDAKLDDGLTTANTLTYTGSAGINLVSGALYDWNLDTGLSRDSAGVIDVGTGAAGSKAGSINLTNLTASGNINVADSGVFGSKITYASSPCETAFAPTTLATGATTTTTGLSCLPANSVIDAVVARVTTTITAACTGWELGDGTTAARFSSNNTTLASGTVTDAAHIGTFNNTGIASATTGTWQAAAHGVVITCAGGNPGAGAIRVVVYYHTWTAPSS